MLRSYLRAGGGQNGPAMGLWAAPPVHFVYPSDADRGHGFAHPEVRYFALMPSYMQLLAHHLDHPERLLLRRGDGRLFVWRGESAHSQPEEIGSRLAAWLVAQDRVEVLAPPLIWFHVDDLPLAAPLSSPSPSLGHDVAR